MAAGVEHAHHAVVGQEGADRQQAAAQGLAQDQPVGPDALVLEGEPLARCGPGRPAPRRRSAGCRCAVHQSRSSRKKPGGGTITPASPWIGSTSTAQVFRRGGGAHAGHVAEVEVREAAARTGRSRRGSRLRWRSRRWCWCGRGNCRAPPGSLAWPSAMPLTRWPQRRAHLIAVSTASAPVFIGSARSKPVSCAELLQERAQRGAVVGARSHRHPLQLPLRRRDDARMQVAVADGRIRAHHVDVLAALHVPDQAVARMVDDHRHRLVVARAVARLFADEVCEWKWLVWRPWLILRLMRKV